MKSHSTNKKTEDNPERDIETLNKLTVRGSGFTYSENQEPTDKSIPIAQAEQSEIVPLPNLGQKNRP
ncbi:MAG TPA: hypothetical protein VKB19_08110 [Pedobacter sp.]|nr:hypothetical protein [Pedobacter sp.]